MSNLTASTKTGRPLKPDQVPEAIFDYLTAYRTVQGFQGRGGGRGGGGRGGGGGGGQKDSSGNCGQHSMWWWGSDIWDSGTPPGAGKGAMGNPAPLVNVLNLYPNNNFIFEKGTMYSVAAKGGVASGQRKPVTCSTFNHQLGFGGFADGTPNPYSMISNENIAKKLDYRRLYMASVWAVDALTDIESAKWGFQGRGGGRGGGGRGGGGSHGGQRIINATIAGKSTQVAIDSGTDAILGAGQGNKQCIFPPSKTAISVPSTSHSQGNPWFCPVWNISQAIRICLTDSYTICQDYGSGGTLSYSVNNPSNPQQGDALNGKEWGTGQPATFQAPKQKPGAPSYTQPIAAPEPQQNQYFNKGKGGRQSGGYGYYSFY